MRPGSGEMRRGVIAAEFFDTAVGFDERQLVVGIKSHAVEEGHLVERAGDCSSPRGYINSAIRGITDDPAWLTVSRKAQDFLTIAQSASNWE